MSADLPLAAAQLAAIEANVRKVLQEIVGNVAARRAIVELVLKSELAPRSREDFRSLLEEIDAFVYRPVVELPPIEITIK